MKILRNITIVLSALVIGAGALSTPTFADSADKEGVLIEMADLADRIEALKAEPGARAVAARERLTAEYRRLSDALGGDDPANLLSRSGKGPRGDVQLGQPKSAPAAPPNCAATQTTFTSAPGLFVSDAAPVSDSIAVVTADTYLWDVDVTTNITHTFASDLDFAVSSPTTADVTLSTDNGGGNDDVFAGTLWDDDAGDVNPPGPVSDNTYANLVVETPLVAEEALAAFIGEDPNGMWTLDLADDAGGDSGTFNDWGLTLTTLDETPIGSATSFGAVPAAPIDSLLPPTVSTINVFGMDPFLCDLDMSTQITHTFASDLDIELTSPGGTTVTITTDNGGGNDDVFSATAWDDDAGTPVTDASYVNGVAASPLVPEEAFGAFIGEDPNGLWTLTITDDAGGDIGTLNSWGLGVTTCECEAVEATGACCSNGPGTQTECFVTTEADCDAVGILYLGDGSICTNDVDCELLLVTFEEMTATQATDGVVIRWTTLSEIETVGFRVLRENGGREKGLDVVVDRVLSAGQSFQGASYEVLDNSDRARTAINYYLEDIDLYGRVTRHGAIPVQRFRVGETQRVND